MAYKDVVEPQGDCAGICCSPSFTVVTRQRLFCTDLYPTLTMQISVLIPVLLQAAASTLAANVGTTGSHNSYNSYNSYNCTAMSDEHSEYCCVQFRSYPGDLNLHPDVELYNYAR